MCYMYTQWHSIPTILSGVVFEADLKLELS